MWLDSKANNRYNNKTKSRDTTLKIYRILNLTVCSIVLERKKIREKMLVKWRAATTR